MTDVGSEARTQHDDPPVAGERGYGLHWHGKRAASAEASTPPRGRLVDFPADGLQEEATGNLMVEGDNLDVLKLLEARLAGRVKLIYIDPPYNTGKDFVFPDTFRTTKQGYLELTGRRPDDDPGGRVHTAWLNMMYPRLIVARRLLRDDGVIMISIDDSEAAGLRLLCNEVFGEENFIATLVWEKGRKNDAKFFSKGHDYVLVFAKSVARLDELGIRWREAKPGAAEVQAAYEGLRRAHGDDHAAISAGLVAFYKRLPKSHPAKALSRYRHADAHGVWRDDNMSWPGGGGPSYDVRHPVTGKPCRVPDGGWRYATPHKMQTMIDAGRVAFRADHTEPPIRKTYLVRDATTKGDAAGAHAAGMQVASTYFYRSALPASRQMRALFGAKVFDNPKDHEVLARLIRYVSSPSKDDIIVDFFAGSGTTAHAVMAQNAADGGTRRFVLVQIPLPLDPAHREQKAAAAFCAGLGKPLHLAELTKEGLRRFAAQVREAWPETAADLGFRVQRWRAE